jgi:hypothetical protein
VKKKLLAATLASLVLAGVANGMDVATFLAKADALKARGVLAMFSSDSREMQAQLKAGAASLRRERLAAQAAGRPTAYCPPEHASLSVDEIFAAMNAVPPPRRARTQVRDALRAAYARKYPCPG